MEIGFRKTAKQYYSDPLFERLLTAVFKKYQGQGGVRGNAKIVVSSFAEANRLQEFFGNKVERIIRPNTILEVPLWLFTEDIMRGHQLTIPDLYELLYDTPLLTKKEEKLLKDHQWTGLFERIATRFTQETQLDLLNGQFSVVTYDWFYRLREGKALGYQIVKTVIRNVGDAENDLFYCAMALWRLLIDKDKLKQELNTDKDHILIPIFADKITRNTHFFDVKFPSGRLFLAALSDIYNIKVETGEVAINENLINMDFMKDRQIYRHFGLMDDSLSSISHVFASGFVDGTSPRTLNLYEIETWNYWPEYSKIYLFENPAVFSYLVLETIQFFKKNGFSYNYFSNVFPPLICTSGQARSATKYFIRKCLEVNPDCTVYYSGDFDLHGLQMLHKMEDLVQKKVVQHFMDAATYKRFLDPDSLSMSSQDRKLLRKMRGDELAQAMAEAGVKVYQESTVADLKEEWISSITGLVHQQVSK